MTLQELITLAGDRDLSKSYPKADGVYIWDYILQYDGANDFELQLRLIPSDSSKAGFKDKVSVDELITYIKSEWAAGTVPYDPFDQMKVVGVEGITIARI
jgi:hypothetical protein